MAHKSHRQKALQSQLEERPAISLVSDEPTKKSKRTKASTKLPTAPVPDAADGGMDVDGDEPAAPAPAMHVEDDDGDILIDNATASTSAAASATASGSGSGFKPLVTSETRVLKDEFRRIPIPPHRITPLKRDWVNLYTPMVEHLGLQVRMNTKRRAVELKVR